MDNTQIASGTGSASSAKLSLEISQLVSRALAGDAIDMRDEGSRLAARFPDLGMSGEMIGSAIARAVSMVGAIRSGAGPVEARAADADDPVNSDKTQAGPDLEDLIGTVDHPILVETAGEADLPECGDSLAEIRPGQTPDAGVVAPASRSPVAALRRALFGG